MLGVIGDEITHRETVQTVYFIFHTKPELLAACYDHAVLGDDDPKPPPQQPWYAALLAATSAEQSMSHFVAGNTAICELALTPLRGHLVREDVHHGTHTSGVYS